MASKFSDTDHGYRKMLRSIEAAGKGAKMTVGIHSEEGAASDGKATIVQVAEWNEFGTERIPARPFISAWADERGQAALLEARDRIAAAVKAGKSTIQALDQLAQKFAGEIQRKISSNIPPPNADSTIARKGSSTTLIDHGQMRASVRGKVEAI